MLKKIYLALCLLLSIIGWGQVEKATAEFRQMMYLYYNGDMKLYENKIVELDKRFLNAKGKEAESAIYNAYRARIECQKGNYSKTQEYLDNSIALAKKSNNKHALAYVYHAYAFYYDTIELNDLAIDYCHKALEVFPSEKDGYLSALIYYTLYSVYAEWDNLNSQKSILIK